MTQATIEASKGSEWFLTQGALGVFCLILIAAVVWLMLRREKDRNDWDKEKADLHQKHKDELRENGKALVQISKDLFTALERVNDLAERFRQ